MRKLAWCVMLFGLSATPAMAQQPKPLPPFVIDVRGFLTTIGQDPTTAAGLGLVQADLPAKAKGIVVDLTFFPRRGEGMTFGIGAEALLGHAVKAEQTDPTTLATTVRTETRLTGLSGQLSLNFGHRDGWSYISAGGGPLRIESFIGDVAPVNAPPGPLTANLGAGARWFSARHVAIGFDVRFYIPPAVATTSLYAGRGRGKLLVLSVGVGIR